MDEATARKFEKKIMKMRAKVIEAKGESVEGLSALPQQLLKEMKLSKERKVKE